MKKKLFGNIAKVILGLCLIFAVSFLVFILKGKFVLPINLVATFFTKGGVLAGLFTLLYIIVGICNIIIGFSGIFSDIVAKLTGKSNVV